MVLEERKHVECCGGGSGSGIPLFFDWGGRAGVWGDIQGLQLTAVLQKR